MKQPSEKTTAKKPYQSPKLLVYGDLTEMTKSAGTKSKPDGGGRRARRTGR
jgi:hypothetical protein